MAERKLYPNCDLKPFPSFTRPYICGVFSLDSQRDYHDGMSNLNYLKIPQKVNFNLNLGDDKYMEKSVSADEEKLKHLLTFIMKNCDKVIINKRVNADFVCFRGLLKTIMCTPYEWHESWIILASKFKETIYLFAVETEQKKNKRLAETKRDKMFQRYGHKFENYIFSNDPSQMPLGSEKPVIENEECCVMFSTKLAGRNSILYGAEIDGIQSNKKITSLDQLRQFPLVEAKVKRRETNERQIDNFYKHKARNFWCQSFLVGIDKIILGLRDDNGFVGEVTEMSLKKLSDEAKHRNYFHATVCVNFLNDFLEKVKYDMRNIKDEPSIIFKYEWNTQIADYIITHQINDSNYKFITQDFVDFMNKFTM
ncbi:hypothetical protein PVAND_001607 [Polypedilum vanderplanki]|uniref:Decapping nuclease n=1 Tax=Polypedilum vanderplanki TaxID=319348 RepID=A0A9J6BNF5_POLVA|nr:hypothetical protein PVAND_001607 [Polypedilum vanderplanki]